MKKTTPQKLYNRLAQYGALSLAIAGVADVSGQIVYTDINPDFVGGSTDSLPIDFDGDNIDDITILQTTSVSGSEVVKFEALAGNGAIASGSLGFYYASNLNSGAIISVSAAFNNSAAFCYGAGFAGSQFCGTDGFIGVKFEIGPDTHYGWVRLEVTDSSNFVVKFYAYNTTPDEAINAGQTTLGLNDNILTKVKIVALNKSIALFNLPQQTNYRLFSLTGQSVLDGKITNNTYVIEANTLATGIYIIELKDNTSNAVIRKKIVL